MFSLDAVSTSCWIAASESFVIGCPDKAVSCDVAIVLSSRWRWASIAVRCLSMVLRSLPVCVSKVASFVIRLVVKLPKVMTTAINASGTPQRAEIAPHSFSQYITRLNPLGWRSATACAICTFTQSWFSGLRGMSSSFSVVGRYPLSTSRSSSSNREGMAGHLARESSRKCFILRNPIPDTLQTRRTRLSWEGRAQIYDRIPSLGSKRTFQASPASNAPIGHHLPLGAEVCNEIELGQARVQPRVQTI